MREKLIELFCNAQQVIHVPHGIGTKEAERYIFQQMADHLIANDVVQVIRCKDCRKISPSVTPIKNAVWCREFRSYMPCDGFCSYGERREGE